MVSQYLQNLHQSEMTPILAGISGDFRRWGTGDVEITNVRILDSNGEEGDVFDCGSELTMEISYFAHKEIEEPEFGIAIFRQDGVQVNGPNNRMAGYIIDSVHGEGVVHYRIESLPLLADAYRVSVAVHDAKIPRAYDFHEQAYTFRVVDPTTNDQAGIIDIDASWEWTDHASKVEKQEQPVEIAE